jgi:hypothetical protein
MEGYTIVIKRSKFTMKNLYYKVLIIIGILLFSAQGFAGTLDFSFSFLKSDLTFTKINEYDLVNLKDCINTGEAGVPFLPRASFLFIIPPDSEVVKVEIISSESEILPGTYFIKI